MRITLGAIREILADYNKSLDRRFVVTDEMVHKIKDYFETEKDWNGTAEELVIDLYEDFLCDCEHEDYCVEEDESMDGPDIHGNPTYHEYQYKICNICGATCPILGIEQTGDGDYDEICGDWER